MKSEKIVFGWHFLPADRKLRHFDKRPVVVGETLSDLRQPECCTRGMHSSVELLDALEYAPGPILCRVASWGAMDKGGDKLAAQHRHVLWMLDATKALREHAAWCAQWALEQELMHGRGVDMRSSEAVDVAFAFADGLVTRARLAAARDAARDAAWAAAWAAARDAARGGARAAAWAAAGGAARDAARGGARAAAWAAAGDAAWAAAWGGAGAAAWGGARAAAGAAARDAARGIFADWLTEAVFDEAKKLGVFVDDVDPRGQL